MSASNRSGLNALADQFVMVTGATTAIGLRMLEMCNGNLERAISMHLDGVIDVDAMQNTPEMASSSQTAGPSIPPDDTVRAPIPSKMDTLVEDVPTFGPVPRQRRARQSVFDGLRDFQAETRIQEEMIRNPKSSSKKRTLEDLFRPPLDLMHKGTFGTAREAGQTQGKWLMVNVQNVREFSCQQLNRDIWSDSTVKSIIRESFIFWQVYHDSDEGQRYMQFYKVTEFPYVSILDPRTGEQMATWHRIDSEAFCDVVMQFLCDHKMDIPDVVPLSPPADSPSSSLPPAKKSRTSSIIDASEESQIEAAIAASLAEAEAAQTRPPDQLRTQPSVIAIESDSDSDVNVEDDDDDDAIETIESDFAFSDSEQSNDATHLVTSKTKETNGQRSTVIVNALHKSKDNVVHEVDDDDRNATMAMKKRTHVKEGKSNGSLIAETKSELSVKDQTRTEGSNSEPKIINDEDNGDVDDVDGKNVDIDGRKKDNAERLSEAEEEGEEHESVEISGPKIEIMLRFPDGKRKQVCLSASSTLKALSKCVAKEGFQEDKYELITNYPRRKLSALDPSMTLSDAGLCHKESIFVQER